jgi:TonB family protein
MKSALLTFMFLLFILSVKAQSGDTTKNKEETYDKVFTSVEQMPQFPGGRDQFYRYIGRTIRYPRIAREKNTQGTVIVTMVVEKDGSLSDIKATTSVGGGCEEEAVRVMKLCPKWNPGLQNDHAVRVAYSVPISFTLVIAQERDTLKGLKDDTLIFTRVEHGPEFPGGMDQFYRYLARTIKYPMAAYKNNTQGKVIIQMVVEKDGSLTHINVARGIGDGCDEEAVRVMKRCPKWKPGTQNGREVRVVNSVPINFTLSN